MSISYYLVDDKWTTIRFENIIKPKFYDEYVLKALISKDCYMLRNCIGNLYYHSYYMTGRYSESDFNVNCPIYAKVDGIINILSTTISSLSSNYNKLYNTNSDNERKINELTQQNSSNQYIIDELTQQIQVINIE